MNINEMTRKQFMALPVADWKERVECDCFIILPTRHIHDSGYRCMYYVAVRNNEPICLIGGGSDVLHIEGIGGYGFEWHLKAGKLQNVDGITPPHGNWSVDCLKRSGLLRVFPGSYSVLFTEGLSSVEVFSIPEKKKPQP